MRKAAIFSAAMHVTLLGAMYVGLPIFHEPEPIEVAPIIEVEFAQLAEVTNPPEPEVEPEPEKKPEPPKPEPPKPDVAHDPPPPPETKIAAVPPEPAPEPEPEPQAEEEPAPEAPKPEKKAKPPEPEPEKKVERKPPPKPKIRPRPAVEKPKKKKKKNFDTNRIAALLDKSVKDKPAPKTRTLDEIEERLKKSERPAPRTARRKEAPVTQGEYDRIKLHIIRHWNPNRGAPGAESMVVRIRIHLRRDGSLDGRPKIIEENAAGQTEQVFRPFADSAVRAVLRSNPLPVPLGKYEAWREIEFTFSLKDMLG